MSQRKHKLAPGVTGYEELPSSDRDFEEILRTQARDAGCTCTPDITLPVIVPGELTQATIAHDDDCALIRRLES